MYKRDLDLTKVNRKNLSLGLSDKTLGDRRVAESLLRLLFLVEVDGFRSHLTFEVEGLGLGSLPLCTS